MEVIQHEMRGSASSFLSAGRAAAVRESLSSLIKPSQEQNRSQKLSSEPLVAHEGANLLRQDQVRATLCVLV